MKPSRHFVSDAPAGLTSACPPPTQLSAHGVNTNELREVTVSVNESDVEDVITIAHEFGILGHVQIEVSGAQEPASSRLLFSAAIADAHADSTGEAALDIARLELRRIIWNSGSQETQVMYVHPPPACGVAPTTEAPCLSLSASPANHPELAAAEIWVCVPPNLFDRMQCKVAELTGALGAALHYRMRVFTLEETDLAKHLPAPGVGRLRFTHDTLSLETHFHDPASPQSRSLRLRARILFQ